MLEDGVPWQSALMIALVCLILQAMSAILSITSGYFNWYPFFTSIFLLIGFILVIFQIPVMLNLSRTFFVWVLFLVSFQIAVTLCSFAFHYKSVGLIGAEGAFNPSFYDAFYFSATTFSTLGYGDFQPLADHRLTTSLEALFGMLSMALLASITWLWCMENLIPSERAFFDGDRRHKHRLGTTRLRVKTLTGKSRKLANWVLPPKPDEVFRYDDERKEWVTSVREPDEKPNGPSHPSE